MFYILVFLYKNCYPLNVTCSLLLQPPSKNWNPTELSFFEKLVEGSTLLRKKGGHYEIMINFKTITKQKLNL